MDESIDLRLFEDALDRMLAGFDPSGEDAHRSLWLRLCEAGLGALGLAEIHLVATAMTRLGGAGGAVPLIGALAANILLADYEPAGRIVEDVRAGKVRIAVAPGPFDGDRSAGSAAWEAGRVTGAVGAVEDVPVATHLLVFLAYGQGAALVDLSQPGVEASYTAGTADPPLANVKLSGATALVIPLEALQAERFVDLMRLLLIARAWGAQRRAMALVLDYVLLRKQFGQAIGRFQAIQHKLADCRVRSDVAELLLHDAVSAFARGSPVDRAVAALVSAAGPGLRRNAVEIQHVFGAVGYAMEHEAPRCFNRVHSDTVRLGGVARARRLLADRMLSAETRDEITPIEGEGEALRQLRGTFRSWLAEHWTADDRRDPARNPDVDFRFIEDLAKAGWLAASWPKEHGGPGFDAFEQFAFLEEMRGAQAPMTLISPTAWIVGRAIIQFGSPDMKAQLLPAIAAGRMTFCLGYSEPQAGSDLAALTTRAVRDGEDYVVNGQKIWTSVAEYASHIFLAARAGEAGDRKHAGVTMFIVPVDAPGVTRRFMTTLHGKTFANVFYDGVRVPAAMRLGAEGEGWKIISSALLAERVVMGGQVASLRSLFVSLVEIVRSRPDMAEDPVVRAKLAELGAEIAAARALSLRSVALTDRGEPAVIEGAIAKLFTGDLAEKLGDAALDLFGVEASLARGTDGALLGGDVNQHIRTALMMVIGGGTAEIQRNTIAQRGLGLPR
jgi:alkylation response protein AidB-like acyl-CoA dehydrogenase